MAIYILLHKIISMILRFTAQTHSCTNVKQFKTFLVSQRVVSC